MWIKEMKDKKVFVFLIACIMVLSITDVAQASSPSEDDMTYIYLEEGDSEMGILAIDACPGRGSHEMFSRG